MEDGDIPQSSRNKFMREQLDEDSPGVRVVQDNTGTKIIKILPLKIEGITKGTLGRKNAIKGAGKRIVTLTKSAIEIPKERQRIKKKAKLTPTPLVQTTA